MQERYMIAVKSQLCVFTTEEETATEEYQRFIKANEDAVKEILPELKKSTRKKRHCNMRIVKARAKVVEAFSKYDQNPEQSSKGTLKEARTSLSDSYNV